MSLACAIATVAFVAVCTFSCLVIPPVAWAYFNEVDDKNSAQQDIGSYGQPIAASDIPEGTYVADVRTSSRMCVFYNTAQDAATRSDNKEMCTITVSGGAIVASFYMSPAYTHLYMGTAAQAAKLSDATGADESAYVKGVPCPISTSSGTSNAYYYTMAVPSLNTPITFTSFDGGSAGIEGGKWFDRQVVFMPGDEITAAIEAARNPQGQSSTKNRDKQSDTRGPSDDDVLEQVEVKKPQVVYVYVDEPEPETIHGDMASNVAATRGEEDAMTEPSTAQARHGVVISPVQPGMQPASSGDAAQLAEAPVEDRGYPQGIALAVAMGSIAMLGFLTRIIRYAREKIEGR